MISPHSTPGTAHHRRLRSVVKQLVIELAHLEYCLAAGVQAPPIQGAVTDIDQAIDRLNDYLSTESQAQKAA